MKTQVLDSIAKRFSPMNFEEKVISESEIAILLEAAISVSSSYNAQPWRFIYAHKGTEMYETLKSFMIEYNQNWSSNADVLMISLSQKISDNGEENYFALHDLGQAMAAMSIQASSMGFQIHQMGGFDFQKAIETLKVPDTFILGSMSAIGHPGKVENLDEHSKERITTNRIRKSISEISGGTDFFTK